MVNGIMVKWLLSIFSSAHDSPPPPHSSTGAVYPVFLFFPRNKEEGAEASNEEKEGKRRGGGRGDPSCVVLPESSVNSVGWGVALCVVCHDVLRRVETSHAKCHKHEQVRGRSVRMRTTTCETTDLRTVYAKPPREMLEDPWTMHSVFCSFIQISSARRYYSWHLEFSALPTCIVNETWPTSS